MLTPTDIHLLVGLFSTLTTPDNVDIVLGEMIYDEASRRKRDIDVTIRYKNDEGEEISFVGLQVKDHNRKLGSPEVEQLCLHFKDSKAIKKGGIVSASGFTTPAKNKAAYHKIDLYEFKDWEYSREYLGHVMFPKDFFVVEMSNRIIQPPHFGYITIEELTKEEQLEVTGSSLVQNVDGTPIPYVKNIQKLLYAVINKMMQKDIFNKKLEQAEIGENLPFMVTLTKGLPLLILAQKKVQLKQLNIKWILEKQAIKLNTQFKRLVKLNDPDYQVGCAITEMSNKLLIGLSTSNNDKSVKLIWIPIAERLKEKIHEIKIK